MLQQRQQEQEERLAKVGLHFIFCPVRGDKELKVLLLRPENDTLYVLKQTDKFLHSGNPTSV